MTLLDPQHLRRTFASVADLLDEAHVRGATIDSEALTMLLDTLAYYANSQGSYEQMGRLPTAAVEGWRQMVEQAQGQMITASSIWEWLRRFFPDPITAGVIRLPGSTSSGSIG